MNLELSSCLVSEYGTIRFDKAQGSALRTWEVRMFYAAFVEFNTDNVDAFGAFESFEEAVSAAWNKMHEMCPPEEGYEIRDISPWSCKWAVSWNGDEIGTYGVIEDEE